MGDGFLLLYKRIETGSLSWPRTMEEAADFTEESTHKRSPIKLTSAIIKSV